MKIAVLIAGVVDPKWPLTLDGEGRPVIAADRLVMSPFDESALELALRLRDADPGNVSITATVAGGAKAEKLARAIIAYNVADSGCVDIPFEAGCDVLYVARALADILPNDADLVLLGREFGDCDNGVLPPLLASRLGRPFFGRAQSVEARADGPRFMRETQTYEQWVRLSAPMVVSVTNDRRSRLRKPLLKNVIMARQARIVVRTSQAVPTGVALRNIAPIANSRTPVDGPKLLGATTEHARTVVDHIRLRMSA
jgi:electron transfer flavoprotein beta subunit